MRKNLQLLSAVLLIPAALSAQITLTQSSYPSSVIGTDSLKKTTSTSTYPSLTAMTNGNWDLSAVTDTTPVYYLYREAPPSGSSYEFVDSNYYNFAGYVYQGNVQSSVTSAGIFEYGVNIPRTGYSLTSVTTGTTDSFIIDAQTMLYSSAKTLVSFPALINNNWASNYVSNFDFQLSVALLSYSNSPGILRVYTTEADTVKGWGLMRVKTPAGTPSSYFNVLQVQSTITTIDSFFINGAPFGGVLLSALGLTQGVTTHTYQQEYYRIEEVTPLAQVTFSDATFTHPTGATTHGSRLVNVGIPGIEQSQIKVYPNPVTENTFTVDLPQGAGQWSYELTDISGKIFKTESINSNGVINLSTSITPGIYFLKINNNGNQVCVKTIEIAK